MMMQRWHRCDDDAADDDIRYLRYWIISVLGQTTATRSEDYFQVAVSVPKQQMLELFNPFTVEGFPIGE